MSKILRKRYAVVHALVIPSFTCKSQLFCSIHWVHSVWKIYAVLLKFTRKSFRLVCTHASDVLFKFFKNKWRPHHLGLLVRKCGGRFRKGELHFCGGIFQVIYSLSITFLAAGIVLWLCTFYNIYEPLCGFNTIFFALVFLQTTRYSAPYQPYQCLQQSTLFQKTKR